jgi:hypothetical protein
MIMKSRPERVETAATDGHVAGEIYGGIISAMKAAYVARVHIL